MKQINLFSNFERNLRSREETVANKFVMNVNVNYDYKINQIQFAYEESDEKEIDNAISKLKSLIEDERLNEEYEFKFEVSEGQKKEIDAAGNENSV